MKVSVPEFIVMVAEVSPGFMAPPTLNASRSMPKVLPLQLPMAEVDPLMRSEAASLQVFWRSQPFMVNLSPLAPLSMEKGNMAYRAPLGVSAAIKSETSTVLTPG